MRTIGTQTLASIEGLRYMRSLRVFVVDEDGTERLIPPEAISGEPRFQTSLDDVAWRLSLTVLKSFPTAITLLNGETSAIITKGRRIVVREAFAYKEDEVAFSGIIAAVNSTDDWSQGCKNAAWAVEAYTPLASAWRAWYDRIASTVTLVHPDTRSDAAGSGRFNLTGIARTYKLTLSYEHNTTITLCTSGLTNPEANKVEVTVANTTGWAVNDECWVKSNYSAPSPCFHGKILAINQTTKVFTIQTNGTPSLADYAPNTQIFKAAGVVSIAGAYFPFADLRACVTVYTALGVKMTSGFTVSIDELESGLPVVFFTITPGATFTIDIMAVDRWVLFNRRWYRTTQTDTIPAETVSTAPAYYTLAGVAGSADEEQLSDPVTTKLQAGRTHNGYCVYVEDPTRFYPTTADTERWASVWNDGVEYRGKVSAVNKTEGDPEYGRIDFTTRYPLKDCTWDQPPVMTGGQLCANTSSTYYEVLDPNVKSQIYDAATAGNYWGDILRFEPQGGFFTCMLKEILLTSIVPGWRDYPACWYVGESMVVGAAGGSYDPALDTPDNDAAAFITEQLTAAGVDLTGASIAPTGYTLARSVVAASMLGDAIDAMRKAVIPPNYRLSDDERGSISAGYIAQKGTADMTLRALQGLEPQEPAEFYTRVIAMGKKMEINRAGQLLDPSFSGIKDVVKLFDGVRPQARDAGQHATMTARTARIPFKLDKCEPGRWPSLSRVCVNATPDLFVNVGIADTPSGTVRWLSPGRTIQDPSQDFVEHEFTGFEAVASMETCFLVVEAYFALNPAAPLWIDTTAGVGEIEVYMAECAYAEAILTSDTELAIDDQGAAAFGTVWNQPDRTKSIFYKYAPPAALKRNKTWFGTGAGVDRANTITAEGITRAQAVELAQVGIDMQLLGAERYTCKALYDPRVQPGDTDNVLYYDDVSGSWKLKRLLVWGILREGITMELTLANYGRQ